MVAYPDGSFASAGGLPTRITQPAPGPLTRAASRHAQIVECVASLRGDLAAVAAAIADLSAGRAADVAGLRQRLDRTAALFDTIERASADERAAIATLRAERGQLQALCVIAEHLNAALERTELLARVLDDLLVLVCADRGGLLLANAQGQLRYEVARQRSGEHLSRKDYPLSRGSVERVWETQEPLLINHPAGDPRLADAPSGPAPAIAALMCAPLCVQGKALGVVYVDRTGGGDATFTADHLDLLAAFCNQAAVAIENANLFIQQRRQMQEIAAIKTYTESVLLSISSGVLAFDNDQRVTRANRAIGRLLGCPPEQLIGQPVTLALQPLRDPAVLTALAKANNDQESDHTTIFQTPVDGRPAPATLSFAWSALRDPVEQRRLGTVLVIDDLTDLEQAQHAAQIFRRYVHPDVVDLVTQSPGAAELGGQARDISILFADLHGYTALGERLPPAKLMALLNDYLALMVQAVDDAGGTVTMFEGDAVMAIFNAPLDQPDHALRAAQAALAMRRAVEAHRSKTGSQQVHIGVGISSGTVLVGNIGASGRLQHYTAIGDPVNLAKRLEEHSGNDEILLAEDTYRRVRDRVRATPLRPFDAKGKTHPVPAFALETLL